MTARAATGGGELATIVRAFLARYDECLPHITDAFVVRELHCGPYSGPDYAAEMKALREAVEL